MDVGSHHVDEQTKQQQQQIKQQEIYDQLLKLTPLEIAKYLTVHDFALFSRISSSELVSKIGWSFAKTPMFDHCAQRFGRVCLIFFHLFFYFLFSAILQNSGFKMGCNLSRFRISYIQINKLKTFNQFSR
jgi:hypothetical protein